MSVRDYIFVNHRANRRKVINYGLQRISFEKYFSHKMARKLLKDGFSRFTESRESTLRASQHLTGGATSALHISVVQ